MLKFALFTQEQRIACPYRTIMQMENKSYTPKYVLNMNKGKINKILANKNLVNNREKYV